mgnify:CR=1 FL=1
MRDYSLSTFRTLWENDGEYLKWYLTTYPGYYKTADAGYIDDDGYRGGFAQVIEVGHAAGKFSLGSFGSSLADSTFWVVLVYGLFINLQNFGIDQSYVQRYITARDDGKIVSAFNDRYTYPIAPAEAR